VEIGRLAILTVLAVVGVAVIMIVAENPGRYAIYDQTYNRNKNSSVKRNDNRIHKTVESFSMARRRLNA